MLHNLCNQKWLQMATNVVKKRNFLFDPVFELEIRF